MQNNQFINTVLSPVPGVEDVKIAVEEKKAYLKVDSKILDKKALDKIR